MGAGLSPSVSAVAAGRPGRPGSRGPRGRLRALRARGLGRGAARGGAPPASRAFRWAPAPSVAVFCLLPRVYDDQPDPAARPCLAPECAGRDSSPAARVHEAGRGDRAWTPGAPLAELSEGPGGRGGRRTSGCARRRGARGLGVLNEVRPRGSPRRSWAPRPKQLGGRVGREAGRGVGDGRAGSCGVRGPCWEQGWRSVWAAGAGRASSDRGGGGGSNAREGRKATEGPAETSCSVCGFRG